MIFTCEYIFCDYNTVHYDDIYNHNVAIYIKEITYDVKLTIYQAKLTNNPFNFKTREEKINMIKLYNEN